MPDFLQYAFVEVPLGFLPLPSATYPALETYVGLITLASGQDVFFALRRCGCSGAYGNVHPETLLCLARNPAVPGMLNQPVGMLRIPDAEEMDEAIDIIFQQILEGNRHDATGIRVHPGA